MKKGLKKFVNSHYLLYCAVACVAFFAVFYWFIHEQRTFIWVPDSSSQHFASFVYLGKYLREIVKNLFAGHLVIPQYNFSMGFGEDILTTLHYYVIGDPLNLISALVPTEYSPHAYSAIMVLRYFLAGLAFTALAKYKKVPAFASTAGALIYIFTGYSLYMAIRHPSFLNPFIYFPLILLGAEMIFDKKRPYLFILSICVSALSSFYFFFAISIFTVLYIFVRLFFEYKEKFVKNFFVALGRFGGSYILGVLMAGLVFLPVVLSFLTSSRGAVEYGLSKFFSDDYYGDFIASFASSGVGLGWGTHMGFSGLAVAGVVLLFTTFSLKQQGEERKRTIFLKVAFIIVTVMMMFPVVSKVINGFSYVTNRWTFIYGLLSAFIFANCLKDIKNINIFKAGFLCITVLLFNYNIRKHGLVHFDELIWQLWIFAFFAMLLFVYSIFNTAFKNKCKAFGTFVNATAVALCVVAVFAHSNFDLNPHHALKRDALFNCMMKTDDAVNFACSNSFGIMQKYQNTENAVERYEEFSGELGNTNSSLLTNTYSTQEYYSMANARVNELYKDIGLVHQNYSLITSEAGDPFVNAAENVKYIVSTWANDTVYGVNSTPLDKFKADINFAEKKIYENEKYVPFGYTFDKVISADDYSKLTSSEKRAMLVNAVVFNDNDEFVNTKAEDLNIGDILPNVTLEADEKSEVYDNKIIVKEKSAVITLRAENVPDGQLYCQFNNISFAPEKEDVKSSWFNIDCNGRPAKFHLATPYYDYYSGINDYTANLGYSDKGSAEVKINIVQQGEYTFDSIHLAVQSLDDFDEKVSALSENTLQNIEIGTDKISGNISLDESKALLISVPYSEYWTAKVDGEEAEILRANTAFMAINLDAGEHTVELKYNNKSIGLSACVSIFGVGLFAGLVVIFEKKRKTAVEK